MIPDEDLIAISFGHQNRHVQYKVKVTKKSGVSTIYKNIYRDKHKFIKENVSKLYELVKVLRIHINYILVLI